MLLLSFTVRQYGVTIDEARYLDNNLRLMKWVRDIGTVGLAASLSRERVRDGWYSGRPENKNLPLVSVVSATGYLLVGHLDEPLAAWRWGNLIVMAVTCGFMYHWVATEVSRPAALVAIAGLLGTPRLFAHANLMAIDTLVGCFWILGSWALFYVDRGWKYVVWFGVLSGIGMTSKLTFWFAIPSWCVWCAVYRRNQFRQTLLSLVTCTPAVALVLIPMWWANPLAGFVEYLTMLREDPDRWNIGVFYFGSVYQTATQPPVPWHSGLVLPLITTPIWLLVLFVWGTYKSLVPCQQSAIGVLWLLGFATLILVCMLPVTPAHDGLRLYRASFYFLPLVAALGFESLRTGWSDRQRRRGRQDALTQRRVRAALFAMVLSAASIWPCHRSHPAQLSYYNPLANVVAAGSEQFEITYWWEVLNPQVIQSMQQHLPPGAKLHTYPHNPGLEWMQNWGYLRDDIEHVVPEEAEFVLLYGRLGQLFQDNSPLGWAHAFLNNNGLWELRTEHTRLMILSPLRNPVSPYGTATP
ncbi:MAG: glycosyltransferase family 39 protein [Planctomycetaceae bacterium]